MAVPEQTPFIEYTANGTTTVFPLPFQCDKSDYLIVNLDGNEAPVGSWSFVNDNVTFNTAPANGVLIEIKRNTPFQRTTEYQSYNNSFRPSPVNKDFDLIWWKLQELGLADWFLNKKLEKEIQDRINADLQLQSEIDQVAHDLFHEIIDRKNADAEVVAYLKAYIQEVMLSAIDIGSINALAITTVDSISALSPLLKWEGRTVFVKSYHSPILGATRPYLGGGNRVYNSDFANINNGGTIINGWVLTSPKWTFEEWGAKGNDPNFDDSEPMQRAIDYVASPKEIGGFGNHTGAKLSCETVNQKYYLYSPLHLEKTTNDDALEGSKFPLNIDFVGSTLIPAADYMTTIVINRWFVTLNQPRIHNELNKSDIIGISFGSLDVTNRQVMGFDFNRIYSLNTIGLKVGVVSRPGASDNGRITNSYYNELYSPVFIHTETAIWMDGNPNALDNQNTRFTIFNPRHIYGKRTFKLDCCDTFRVFGGSSEIIYTDIPGGAVIEITKSYPGHSIDNSASFHGFVSEAATRAYNNESWDLGLLDCIFISMQEEPITNGGREIVKTMGRILANETRLGKPVILTALHDGFAKQIYMQIDENGTPEIYADSPIKISQAIQTLTIENFLQVQQIRGQSADLQFRTANSTHVCILNTATADQVLFYNTGNSGSFKFGGASSVNPLGNNNTNLGSASERWSQVYAATGTIQTSDERLKQDFRQLTAAEKAAAIDIKNNIGLYRFKDAVLEKGDQAREHVGILAQKVIQVLTDHGLDWRKYSFICFDEWQKVDDQIVTIPAVYDENGVLVKEEQINLIKGQPAGDRYSIRYDELIMFILSTL